MKIRIDNFKGEAPRISDRSLGEGFASETLDASLLDTDLTPIFADSAGTPNFSATTSGDFNTIYPLDADQDATDPGPHWLYWPNTKEPTLTHDKVDVARGSIKDDQTERVYYTGAGVPKVTNLSLATGIPAGNAAQPYPFNSQKLGINTFREIVDLANDPSVIFNDVDDLKLDVKYDFDFRPGESLTDNPDNKPPDDDYTGGDYTEFLPIGEVILDAGTVTLPYISPTESAAIYHPAKSLKTTPFATLKFTFNISSKDDHSLVAFPGLDETGKGWGIRININPVNNNPSFGTTYGVTVAAIYIENFRPVEPLKQTSFNNGQTFFIAPNTEFTMEVRARFEDNLLLQDSRNIRVFADVTEDEGATYTRTEVSNFNIAIGDFWGFTTCQQDSTINTVMSNVKVTQFGIDAEVTNYVYTLVNSFGEEGVPSPPSDDIFMSDDLIVYIDPSSSYGLIPEGILNDNDITEVRLYRAVTDSSGNTEYLLVSVIDVGGPAWIASFDDNNLDAIGPDVLQSYEYTPPPTDGHSIVSLANGITLIASKNTIYPSVQYRPHAYPDSFSIAVDDNIITMVSLENQAVVLTARGAYIIYGDNPAAMTASKVPQAYGCSSARSAVVWGGFGVVYACPDGIAAISGNQSVLLSEQFMTKRDWEKFYPQTIHAVVHDDKYHMWYRSNGTDLSPYKSISFDPRNNGAGFVQSSSVAEAAYTNPYDDELYLGYTDTIYKYQGGVNKLTYLWKSKKFMMPYPTSFSCGIIRGEFADTAEDQVTLQLFKESSTTPFFTTTIQQGDEYFEFVLPPVVCREIFIQLTGKGRVHQIEIADEMMELA